MSGDDPIPARPMQTQIQIPAVLRKYAPDQLDVSHRGGTVKSLLQELSRSRPQLYRCLCDETGRLRRHINLFLDDDLLDRERLDTRLKPGVVVSVFQAVSGG